MIGTIIQYSILGLYIGSVGSSGYFDQLDFRAMFRVTKWIDTTKPYYKHLDNGRYDANAQLQLQTEWDCWKVLTFHIGMRGVAGKSFYDGFMGGNWGLELRFINDKKSRLTIGAGIDHESLHATDNAARAGGKPGSEDYYYFYIGWNWGRDGQRGVIDLFK